MADHYLGCPRCDHRVWISLEDEDGSLSLMVSHFRTHHPEQDELAMLALVHGEAP